MEVFGALRDIWYIFRFRNITLLLTCGASCGLLRACLDLLLGGLACTSRDVGSLLGGNATIFKE